MKALCSLLIGATWLLWSVAAYAIPDIRITKQGDGMEDRMFPSGSDVPFDIVVSNVGDVDLANVEVFDPQVPDLDRVIGFLAVGDSVFYTGTAFNVTVSFTNIVSATGEALQMTVMDQDPSGVTIGSGPFIDIRKQAEGADSRTFPSGSDVPFEIVVTNIAAFDLVDVEVFDPLVPDLDRFIGDLAAGASVSYTGTAADVTAGFINVATVVGSSGQGQGPFTDEDPSTVEIRTVRIPEPGTLVLFAFGLAGLGFMRRRVDA